MSLNYKTVRIDEIYQHPKCNQNTLQNPVLMVLNFDANSKYGWTIKEQFEGESDIPILLVPSNDRSVLSSNITHQLAGSINEIIKKMQKVNKIEKTQGDTILKHGLLELNLDSYQVFWDRKLVDITYTEFFMLKGMLKNPNRVYSRENIIDFAYGMKNHINYRTIDSHMRHIRKKFTAVGCRNIIKTVHGIGYKIDSCEES